jgi:hypothetical protein
MTRMVDAPGSLRRAVLVVLAGISLLAVAAPPGVADDVGEGDAPTVDAPEGAAVDGSAVAADEHDGLEPVGATVRVEAPSTVEPGAVVPIRIVVDAIGADVARVAGSLTFGAGDHPASLASGDDGSAECDAVELTALDLADTDGVLLACELHVDPDAAPGSIPLSPTYALFATEDGEDADAGPFLLEVTIEVAEALPAVTADDVDVEVVVPGIRDAADGEVAAATVRVTNTSSRPLAQVRLTDFGGCAAATLTATDLAPGATATLGCDGPRPLASVVGSRVLEVTPTDASDRFQVTVTVPAPLVFDAQIEWAEALNDEVIEGLPAVIVFEIDNPGQIAHATVLASLDGEAATACSVAAGGTAAGGTYILECLWLGADAGLVAADDVRLTFSVTGFDERFQRTVPSPLAGLPVLDEVGLLTCPSQVAVGTTVVCSLTDLFPDETVLAEARLGTATLFDQLVTVDGDGNGAFSFRIPTDGAVGSTVVVTIYTPDGEFELVTLELTVVAGTPVTPPTTSRPVAPHTPSSAPTSLPRTGTDLFVLTLLGAAALSGGVELLRRNRIEVRETSAWGPRVAVVPGSTGGAHAQDRATLIPPER